MACAAVVVALIGCESVKDNDVDGGGDDVQAVEFTLAIDQTSITLPIASTLPVTVSVARGSGVGDILLSTGELPANLAVTFSPNPLPPGTDTAQMMVTALGGTSATTSTFDVKGSSGSIEHRQPLSVTTRTIDVAGKVRGNLQDVKVGIVGKPAVLSGVDGVFSFTDVTPPYDLYVIGVTGAVTTIPAVNYYAGLTRPDPIVTPPRRLIFIAPLCLSGQVCTSMVSGFMLGLANSNMTTIAWSNGGVGSGQNASYNITAGGFTNNQSVGTMYAFQYTKGANGAPTGFVFGSAGATLNSSQTNLNLSLNTLTTTNSFNGTITPPANFPMPTITLTQQFGKTNVDYASITSLTFSGVIPAIPAPNLATSLFVTTSTGGATSSYSSPLLNATNDVTYSLPVPPTLTAPAASGTGVNTFTPITWTGDADTVFSARFSSSTNVFNIFTTSQATTIPVIPEFSLASNTQYTWSVVGFAGHGTVDEAAATEELENASTAQYSGSPRADASSASRTFTTAN